MITRLLSAATVGILALSPTKPTADVTLSFIEYRVLQSVGEVRLTTGFVHDAETQKTMLADLQSSDRQGIILIAGDSPRRFSRRDSVSSHLLETTISVYPPVGHGYRGGLASADIVVTIDGKKRIDCDYDRGSLELVEVDILPIEGVVSIVGSYDGKNFRGTISLNGNEKVDAAWLHHSMLTSAK